MHVSGAAPACRRSRASDPPTRVGRSGWAGPFTKRSDTRSAMATSSAVSEEAHPAITRAPTPTSSKFGCGPMNCRRYLPRGAWYNAMDIAFSEFQLRRVLRPGRPINLCIGSAAEMPLEDDGVSMLVSVEVLYCILTSTASSPRAAVLRRGGGVMICSVANAPQLHEYHGESGRTPSARTSGYPGFHRPRRPLRLRAGCRSPRPLDPLRSGGASTGCRSARGEGVQDGDVRTFRLTKLTVAAR